MPTQLIFLDYHAMIQLYVFLLFHDYSSVMVQVEQVVHIVLILVCRCYCGCLIERNPRESDSLWKGKRLSYLNYISNIQRKHYLLCIIVYDLPVSRVDLESIFRLELLFAERLLEYRQYFIRRKLHFLLRKDIPKIRLFTRGALSSRLVVARRLQCNGTFLHYNFFR